MSRFRYKHIQSTVEDKVPSGLLDGEIAVNRFKGKEKLFLKNASGDVVSFSSDSAIDGKLAEKLNVSDFNTYSGTVDTAINSKASESDLETLSGTVTGHTADTNIHVTTADKTAWNNKVDDSDIVNFIDDAKYENSGTTKVINLYHGSTIKATIDCTDFIKDGMIDDVRIETISGVTYLVIDFNTASGKEDIKIPLTDIFNPANYYTKSETSGATELSNAFAQKLAISDFNTYSGAIDTLISSKASQSDLTALSGTVTGHTSNTDIHLTTAEKTNIDSLATNIAVISGITSTNVGNWDNAAADSHTHSNKSALDAITGNVGTMAYENVSSYSSATEVNSALGNKLGISDFNTYSGAVDTEIGSKASQSDLNTLSGTVTAHTASTNIHLTSAEKTNLDSLTGAVGTMAYQDTDSYYAKNETSGKTEISNALGTKVNSATFTGHTADTSAHFSCSEKENLDSLATNIAAISGITAEKVTSWDNASSGSHTHSNKTYLDGITGSVGTMAYQNASSYSSATEVNTALSGKSDTGHTHDDRYYTESELTGSSTTVVVAKAASATTAATAAVANSVALSAVTDADDLKAIEALAGTSGLLKKTAANTWSLDTNSYSTTAVAVTGATYNTTNKTIDLKNADGTVVSTVDATDFIKDGMISGVTLETKSGTTYLVISWNTDAGIETTELNIGDLFDADNYYTKNELTGSSTTVVVAKASSASTAASAGSVALSNVTGADDLKAIEAIAGTNGILKKTAANTWSLDTTSYSSATEVNTALGNKLDKSDFNAYSGAVDTAINSKASQSTVDALNTAVTAHTANTSIHLTSTEKSNLDSLTGAVGTMAYENKNSYSSATEVNTALAGKQDVVTAGSGITITDNEISVDDTVALVDGTYPDLTAGNIVGEFSDNNAEFAYRPTAGAVDIESGQADFGGHLENIKGNTIAWNQLYDWNATKDTFSNAGVSVVYQDGWYVVNGTATYGQNDYRLVNIVEGHKYYINYIFSNQETHPRAAFYAYNSKVGPSNVVLLFNSSHAIGTGLITCSASVRFLAVDKDIPINNVKYKINFIDLTLIYGEGNEPTTVEQFEADYQKWFGKPLTYEEYDEGSLRNVKMTGIKTVGFNLWDEEWLDGYYDNANGNYIYVANQKCTKNKINILPNTQYYLAIPVSGGNSMSYYDKNGVFLSPGAWSPNQTFTTPADACCMNINFGAYGSSTYNHDICINLHHSGDRDGEYESYWESTLNVPVTTLKGKLNGTGSSVTVFPDGMKKAGTVYDEIVRRGDKTYAIKRVGSVDMGTLTWSASNTQYNYRMLASNSIPDSKIGVADNIENLKCAKYNAVTADNTWSEIVGIGIVNHTISVYDLSYNTSTSASDFKTAMSGVYLFYELATPEEYILDDFELPQDYDVDDWGTEEILLGTNGCAPILDLKYGINAGDTIKNLSHNYVSAVGEQNFTEAQKARARKNIDALSSSDIDDLSSDVDDLIKQSETISAAINDLDDKKADSVEVFSSLSTKANKSDINDLETDVEDLIKQSETISAALNYLNDEKLDYVDFFDYTSQMKSALESIEDEIEDLSRTVVMDITTTDARGYGESTPTLAQYTGNKSNLNGILSHFKLGWFNSGGTLVQECAPGRISAARDGSEIAINGSNGDLMVYVDTDIYRDRATVSGLTVNGSTATTHNVIGLGLAPHQIGGSVAKKFSPFGFTPHCAKYSNGKGYSYYDGGNVQTSINSLASSVNALNKGGGYMGLYYEFYEIWLIAMYLELGTLDFTQDTLFGYGCTNYTPTASNWFSDVNAGGGGCMYSGNTYGSFWSNTVSSYNFAEMLEAQRIMDGVVKADLVDSMGGTVMMTYDSNGNVVLAPEADPSSWANSTGMTENKKYFTVKNVPGCQGLGDGVMTGVVNIYVKGTDRIRKYSHPIYRGVDLLSGFFVQLEGLHYVVKHTGTTASLAQSQELFYCESWLDVPTDTSVYTNANSIVTADTAEGLTDDPVLVSTYRNAGAFPTGYDGWGRETDYNISLFAHRTTGGAQHTYECGHIWYRGTSWASPAGTDSNGWLTKNAKSANASVVGCYAVDAHAGRTLDAYHSVANSYDNFAGGFAHPQIKVK